MTAHKAARGPQGHHTPDEQAPALQVTGDRYELRFCAARRFVELRMHGEWDMALFERFSQDYLAACERIAALGGATHMLIDARDYGIQPREVAEGFPALIAASPRLPEQRTASVVPSLVNRIQARAGGDLVNVRYFRTAQDATDWLFSDEA